MFSLANKFALITGAGSGIGAAIARTFAQVGAHVVVTDCAEEPGRGVAAEIVAAGGRAEFLTLDVTDESQCASVARAVLASAGRLDILVNNAGIGHVGTMADTTAEDFDRV